MLAEGDGHFDCAFGFAQRPSWEGGLRRQGGLTTEIHGYFAALRNLAGETQYIAATLIMQIYLSKLVFDKPT